MSVEAELQSATQHYQSLQSDVAKLVNRRQVVDAQLSENRSVSSSLSLGSSSASSASAGEETVYKLIGPVLVKQDREEARANVSRRIEYLSSDLKRIDEKIGERQKDLDAKKLHLVHLQSQLQQARA